MGSKIMAPKEGMFKFVEKMFKALLTKKPIIEIDRIIIRQTTISWKWILNVDTSPDHSMVL